MAEQINPEMTTVFVTNETVGGTCDFSNTTFTLVNQPAAGAVRLYMNGIKLTPTTDYTVSGKTITMVEAPHTNDVLVASYCF